MSPARDGGGFLFFFSRFANMLFRFLFLVGALAATVSAWAEPPSPARQRALVHLVRQDCGSCHGMTLQGGLGPALTPQALRGKPAESLVAAIVGGRPGTPMPPWQRFVSEDEAAWIVDRLQAGFPP